MTLLQKACDFARIKHEGQEYDGGAFMIHLTDTYQILKQIAKDDTNLLASAWLHDTLENTETTYEELYDSFNKDVADLVLEVTKTEYNTFPDLKTRRGIMLKYADRLSNLSHISVWPEKRQHDYLKKSKFWKS